MTPRQIAAVIYHLKAEESRKLAELTHVIFAGAQCSGKDLKKFIEGLTRDV
jgi:hypothetical protein